MSDSEDAGTMQEFAQLQANHDGVPIDVYEQPVEGREFGHVWFTPDVSENDRRYCTEVKKWRLLASAAPETA